MSFFTVYPQKYLDNNEASSHKLNIVFEMDGADTFFSIQDTLKVFRYGEPGLLYGNVGLVYGGSTIDTNSKNYILTDSSLMISQKVEPEQGRGSASTMTFVLLDKNGEVTNFFTPGQVVDEPVGNKLVKVWIGYANTNYPEDYFTVFRGYISSLKSQATKTTVQLTDSNIKRRSQVFFQAKTTLTSAINDSTTTIPVASTTDFHRQILGPDGTYDPAIDTYIQIEDEVMSYGPTDVTSSQFTVTRGVRDTTNVAHDVDSDVTAMFQIEDNAIDIALKIMLSGWNGPWKVGQEISSIQDLSNNTTLANALELPTGVDAVNDLGVTTGDYFYITGSVSGNDGTYIVQTVESISERSNNVIKFTTNFVAPESDNPLLVASIRSKYDVYPTTLGVKLTPPEVDVSTYEQIRDTYFIDETNLMRFYTPSTQSGKEFIEKEIMLPLGAYSITRLGTLSMNVTQQPIVDSDVQILSRDNILNPKDIYVERATNNRRYFNEVQYEYDQDDNGVFRNRLVIINATSLSNIAISSVLPIPAAGFRTELGSPLVMNSRGNYLIQRYSNIALYIEFSVNWKTGSIIETGDSAVLKDNGELKIANYATGDLNIGEQVWEVILCNKDPKAGTVKLGLLSGTGFYFGYRYGGIAPSSAVVGAGSTVNQIQIMDSYGIEFPGNEKLKWTRTLGQPIIVHNYDYSQEYETILTSFDATGYIMNVNPPLPVAPSDDWTVEIPPYPDSDSQTEQRLYKLYYTHFDPSVAVVSGVSGTEVEVDPSDIGKFKVGNPISTHNEDYSIMSPEVTISGVDTGTNTVTVSPTFGFTPDNTYRLELIGFLDSGQPYRWS